MSTKKYSLSIILVNYNGQFWLKQTLSSLQEWYLHKTKRTVQVILVDNASTDDSMQMVKKEYKWVKRIELEKNVGFAAANNIGIKKSNSEFVMLLNSDTELTQASNLDIALRFLKKSPQVGVVTPKLTLPDGNLDWACHRGEPTPWASFCYFTKLSSIFSNWPAVAGYHQTYKDLSIAHQIDACSGAAMILRRSAINQVGLLDEQFFMYAEDLDWCKRFREAGWQIWYLPQLEIIHHKNKSGITSQIDTTRLRTTFAFYDTMLQYYDKHYAKKYPSFFRQVLQVFIEYKKGQA